MESPRVYLRNSQSHSLLILLQTIGNKITVLEGAETVWHLTVFIQKKGEEERAP